MKALDGPRRKAKSGNADSLVIFVHGYGADGADLISLSQTLADVMPNTEFVAPNGPEPCRVNAAGKQWFPISYIDGSSRAEMMEGFAAAQTLFHDFIDRELERSSLPASRIALVGFSQGTMMSLAVGLRRAEQLAAIVGFSGKLLDADALKTEIASRPPVLLIHGDADDIVPPQSLPDAVSALEDLDVPVEGLIRPGLGHGIDERGVIKMAESLIAALSKK